MAINDVFTKVPTLRTERLVLREIKMDDVEAIFVMKSDFEVTSHYGAEPHVSIDKSRNWVEQRIEDYKKRNAIFWAIDIDDAKAIGLICFWNFDHECRSAEIGYESNRSYWSTGVMSEALRPIIEYGFGAMGLHRIEALPMATNIASKKLLIRLGFKQEGVLRERIYFRGNYFDQIHFGLLDREWANHSLDPEPKTERQS